MKKNCPRCGGPPAIVMGRGRALNHGTGGRAPAWIECQNCGKVIGGQKRHVVGCNCEACKQVAADRRRDAKLAQAGVA